MNHTVPTVVDTTSGSYKKAKAKFYRTLGLIICHAAADHLWECHFRRDERKALGGSLDEAIERHGSTYGMWAFVRNVTEQMAVLEIGEAFNILSASDVDFVLREAGELPRDPDEARDAAIERGDLVLTRQPRRAYWEGKIIDADWHRYSDSWSFLVTAAECAVSGDAVDHLMFLGPNEGEDEEEKRIKNSAVQVVAKKKNRLKDMRGFPESLIKCFKVVGTGAQRLEIPRDKIHIFDRGDD